VCERQAPRAAQVIDAAGLVANDPDRTSDTVRSRMHHSLFSQGWLPMLGEQDAAWMIDTLGLGGEYTKVEPVRRRRRRPGGLRELWRGFVVRRLPCPYCQTDTERIGLT
jgi:hypothetical protein